MAKALPTVQLCPACPAHSAGEIATAGAVALLEARLKRALAQIATLEAEALAGERRYHDLATRKLAEAQAPRPGEDHGQSNV